MRKSTIVPNITMMREAVANVTQSTLLDVLLDGVEGLFFADLHFSVSPARNFDDHVEDAVILVSEERDVVPWAEGGLGPSRFKVGTVLWERSNSGMRRTLISVVCVVKYREGGHRPSSRPSTRAGPIGTSAQASDGRMRVVVNRRGCHKKTNKIGQW